MAKESIGRYVLLSEIGRGGMATVYLADDPNFHRKVAIKLVSVNLQGNPTIRARFEREAQTIAAIEHPAIVPVYDFGEHEEQLFLVMRFMAGGTLSSKIHQAPLSLDAATQIISQLAPALDAVHAQGVVHRDLKPGNILFDNFGNVAISDFGIAHITESTNQLTGSAVLGTPSYMSPEQVRAKDSLDGRSDIYALGIILFEMLSGRIPFKANTPISTAMKHISAPIPSIRSIRPELPLELDNIMMKVLAKNRDDRFSKASELAQALADLPKVPPVFASSPSPSSTEAFTEIDAAEGSLVGAFNPLQPVSREFPQTVPPPKNPPGQNSLANSEAFGTPAQPQQTTTGMQSSMPWMQVAGALGIGGILVIFCIVLGLLGLWVGTRKTTPTTMPQSTPTITAAPLDLFLDDFSNSSSGWPNEQTNQGELGYISGGYHINVITNDTLLWASTEKVFDNSSILVDARVITEAANGYFGLLCRITDVNNYYYFVIRNDGYYTMGKYKNGGFESFFNDGWRYSDNILQGKETNRIQIECNGSSLRMMVNDSLLGEASDPDFKSGESGVATASLGNRSFEVLFDNFRVIKPEN